MEVEARSAADVYMTVCVTHLIHCMCLNSFCVCVWGGVIYLFFIAVDLAFSSVLCVAFKNVPVKQGRKI